MQSEDVKFQIKITEIEVIPILPRGGLIGFCSFILSDQLFIGDVGIHARPNGSLRLVYPVRTLPNGKVLSCVHPINREVGMAIEKAVSDKYQDVMKKAPDEGSIRKSRIHTTPQRRLSS